jgi:hypothetical protein
MEGLDGMEKRQDTVRLAWTTALDT